MSVCWRDATSLLGNGQLPPTGRVSQLDFQAPPAGQSESHVVGGCHHARPVLLPPGGHPTEEGSSSAPAASSAVAGHRVSRQLRTDHHTGQQHGGYWIEWEDPQVSVELTEEQLRALMTEAMMAQAQAATAAS